MRYFEAPPKEFYFGKRSANCENIYYEKWLPQRDGGASGEDAYPTYTEYNYLGSGLAARIKSRHFEVALRLTQDLFGANHAIDLGCADGVFLPSLSKHFASVCGIEQHPPFARLSRSLVESVGLPNVTVLCNEDIDLAGLKERIPEREYRVLFLLEVIEHVGDRDALYESKLAFLRGVFGLLEPDGVVVLSVPRMVGLSFLAQRMGFAVLGVHREAISMRNLLRASFLCDTADLREEWDSSKHLGFNDRELEQSIYGSEFRIVKKRNLLFQKVLVISRR